MPSEFSFRHSNETEISNIKAGHLSKIPPEDMANLKSSHMEHFRPEAFKALKPEHLEKIPPETLSGFKAQHFEEIPPPGLTQLISLKDRIVPFFILWLATIDLRTNDFIFFSGS